MKLLEGWKLVPVEADDSMVETAVQGGTSAIWNEFIVTDQDGLKVRVKAKNATEAVEEVSVGGGYPLPLVIHIQHERLSWDVQPMPEIDELTAKYRGELGSRRIGEVKYEAEIDALKHELSGALSVNEVTNRAIEKLQEENERLRADAERLRDELFKANCKLSAKFSNSFEKPYEMPDAAMKDFSTRRPVGASDGCGTVVGYEKPVQIEPD